MKFLGQQLRRFSHAFAGIRYAVLHDRSFRLQWYGMGTITLLLLILLQPLSTTEYMFIVLAHTLILITELQNSALEYALDHLHPNTHESIGRSKDMAAGAVLIAGLFFLGVTVTLCINHLW